MCTGYPLGFQIFDNELKDQEREVCFVDIAYDEIPERYFKESEVSEILLLNYYLLLQMVQLVRCSQLVKKPNMQLFYVLL